MSETITAAVPSVRAFAYDDDSNYVVERAPNPPTLADARFRERAVPIAARIADQLRVARDLMAGAALDRGARAAIGRGLQDVVAELRALAESYAIDPVADVLRAREAGAAMLDQQAVTGIEHVAHGLLTAAPTPDAVAEAPASEPPAAEAPAAQAPAPEAPAGPTFRPPTGPALVELLAHGITGIERWPGTPLDMPAVPTPAPVPAPAPDADGVVSIDALLYRGRAALDRAREIRDELRAAGDPEEPPDPEDLAELYDLLDLAATD